MIKIKNLTFGYQNNLIFNQSSLVLPDNGVFILKGDNGCGKSTLLKIISGDLINENITLEYNGSIINNDNRQYLTSHITYIAQTNNFVSFLNASENASLGNVTHRRKINTLTLLNNEKFKNRKECQLSNGEKVLITLERAINENKNIILLDECSDFLDDYNTNIIIDSIKKISDKSLIIIVSHDERIINAFPNHISIENHKLISNFTYKNHENRIGSNDINICDKSNSLFITKKLVNSHSPFILLFSLLLFLFNSLFLTGLSLLNYSITASYISCLDESYYVASDSTYKRVTINDASFKVMVSTSEVLKQETTERILNDFDIRYYKSTTYSNDFLISTGPKIGKAKISSEKYNQLLDKSMIEDDRLCLYTHETKLHIPYVVIDDEETEKFPIIISQKDLDVVEYKDPINVNGAIWENDNFSFSDNESIKKLLSIEGTICFLTKDMYENKYGVALTNTISNNNLYISKTLRQIYNINNKLKFFNFENVNMEWYRNSFFNLNEVLSNIYLVSDFTNNSLIGNEVIISDENYNKIASLNNLIGAPIIHLDKSNIKLIEEYYKDNIKLRYITDQQNEFKYNLRDFYKFQDFYNENAAFYSAILMLLFVPEVSIIYIVIKWYKINNYTNSLIISRYYNKRKTAFIFSVPYLISLIIAFITSLFGTTFLLKLIFKNLEFNIMPIQINFISISLLLVLNSLLYLLMRKIKK